MCGRFHRTPSAEEVARRFKVLANTLPLEAQYNIAPTEEALVVLTGAAGRQIRLLKFGLEVSWAEQPLVNIRAESFTQKPGFRRFLDNRRCLVPADGFYEWKRGPKGSQPFRYGRADGALFGLAAVYENDSFAIITTEANKLVKEVHHRMPVLLRPEDEETWLDPAVHEPSRLLPMLAPFASEAMRATTASRLVNSARYKGSDCWGSDPSSETQPTLF